MKLAFVADINSPIARNWISFFVERDDRVDVICQYPPAGSPLPGARISVAPLLVGRFNALSSSVLALQERSTGRSSALRRGASRILRGLNARLGGQRLLFGYGAPLEAARQQRIMARLLSTIAPDLVHGLRIPMEGASLARVPIYPVVLSVWGNDFTLWANGFLGHRRLARAALRRADALHADCRRDIRLAYELGYSANKPVLVSPGGGGVRLQSQIDERTVAQWRARLGLSRDAVVVLNPRGIRTYVRTVEYLRALPAVLRAHPNTVFVSVAAAGDPTVTALVERLGLGGSVRALPTVSHADLAALFSLATIFVSPTVHDGTPNTLLEAMAQGVFPVVGDLESIREWISDGENGLLVDPNEPADIARGVNRALADAPLRERAGRLNRRIVSERADYGTCMARVRDFYVETVARSSDTKRCL